MAHTWYLARQKGQAVVTPAGQAAGAYLDWIYGWLQDNPDALYVPSEWGQPGWRQGQPWPAGGCLDPHGTTQEPHDMTLCLKGAIACGPAGALTVWMALLTQQLQVKSVASPDPPQRVA